MILIAELLPQGHGLFQKGTGRGHTGSPAFGQFEVSQGKQGEGVLWFEAKTPGRLHGCCQVTSRCREVSEQRGEGPQQAIHKEGVELTAEWQQARIETG